VLFRSFKGLLRTSRTVGQEHTLSILPVMIICTTIYMVGVRVFGSLILQMRKSVAFGWRPSEAYLAGKGTEKKEEETGKKKG
jgi:hypothetical protein